MSPRCPECDKISTGIAATPDGHEIQPCGCAADNVPLSELESPYVDRGRGVATDGGRQDAPAIQLYPTDVHGPSEQADDVAFIESVLGDRYDIEVQDDPEEQEVATDGGTVTHYREDCLVDNVAAEDLYPREEINQRVTEHAADRNADLLEAHDIDPEDLEVRWVSFADGILAYKVTAEGMPEVEYERLPTTSRHTTEVEKDPDVLPDGGTIVGDPSNPAETASPHTEEESQ